MTYSGELIGMIHLENTEHETHLTLTTADNKAITLVWNKTQKGYTVDIRATDAGVEIGKLTGTITLDGDELRDLTIWFSTGDGVAKLTHHTDGMSFSGQL
jgi:hypothetical protein